MQASSLPVPPYNAFSGSLRFPAGLWCHAAKGILGVRVVQADQRAAEAPVSPSPTEPRSCPRGCCYTTPDRFTAYCLEVGKAGSYPSISPSPGALLCKNEAGANAAALVVAHPAAAGRGEGTFRLQDARLGRVWMRIDLFRKALAHDRLGPRETARVRAAEARDVAAAFAAGLGLTIVPWLGER